MPHSTITHDPQRQSIKAVLFDYGGVVAEEGFRDGLHAIARQQGLDPVTFFNTAADIVYRCGYVTGTASEHDFWQAVRQTTGILGDDMQLSGAVLDRFIPRPAMLAIADRLRKRKLTVVVLSDQSDWLDRLEARHRFSRHFDAVYNSFHLGRSKKDINLFREMTTILDLPAGDCLFVDDNAGHIGRAAAVGMQTHLFTTVSNLEDFLLRSGLLDP